MRHGLLLAWLASSTAAELICPVRTCLPEDSSEHEGKTQLCYTNLGEIESFAQCVDAATPSCTRCSSTPPCESWCEADVYKPLPLGSPCHLDRQCGGDPFAACHFGVCRRALWAGQRCDAADPLSVCLFGQQRCDGGVCVGLGTNEECWDGYPAGFDLDCKLGWYCLRSLCVPQLPNGHTCFGENPNECIRGHRCNLAGKRPQCTRVFSLPIGARTSDRRLCATAHANPRTSECAVAPPDAIKGGDCRTDADCARSDGSSGQCRCKLWWQGTGLPGFCEFFVPEVRRPSYMEFHTLQIKYCHHDWPEERCAIEMEETELMDLLSSERKATADPTAPVPDCARSIIPVAVVASHAPRRRVLDGSCLLVLSALRLLL